MDVLEQSYTANLKRICYSKEENGIAYARSWQELASLTTNPARALLQIINNEQKRGFYTSPEYFAIGGEAVLIKAKDELNNIDVIIKFIKPYIVYAPGQKQKVIVQDKNGHYKPHIFKRLKTIPTGGIETENTLRFRFGAENQQVVYNQLQQKYGFSIGYCPKVLNLGISPKLYLIQEFVKGEKSLDYIRLNNLSDEERILLFLKLLKIVEVIHNNDIVHSDLTPDNVLIMENGFPCIVDFSLSKNLESKHQVTQMATSFGKWAFASDHQMSETKKRNYKDDIHTLAKVCYCFFMGEVPIKAPGISRHEMYEWSKMPDKIQGFLISATNREYADVKKFREDIGQFYEELPQKEQRNRGQTDFNNKLQSLKEDLNKTKRILSKKIKLDQESKSFQECIDRIEIIEKRVDKLEEINQKLIDSLK